MKDLIGSKINKAIKARRRVSTRPIDRFHNCYMLDSQNNVAAEERNGINDQQWRAADRLSNNHQLIFLSGGWNADCIVAILRGPKYRHV